MSRSVADLVSRAWENHQLISLMLEMTYACELDCSFCYNDRSKRGRPLGLPEYRDILMDARDLGCLYLTLTGGEPTLSPHFFAVGSMARELRMAVRIKTHGSFLDEGKIRRIRREVAPVGLDISIHGDDPESHDVLTRIDGSFDRLMRNLRVFREEGLRVMLRCPVTRLNQDRVERIADLADSLGMPIKFSPEISPRDDGDVEPRSLVPDPDAIRRLYRLMRERSTGAPGIDFADEETTDEHREFLTTRYNCGAGTGSLTVDPYGEVLPCVAWRRGVGNVRDISLKKIWSDSLALSRVREANEEARTFHQSLPEKYRGMVFCPGRAEQEKGSPLTIYSDLDTMADAAQAASMKEEESHHG